MGIAPEELALREMDQCERDITGALATLGVPPDDRRWLLSLPPKRVGKLFARVDRLRWLMARFGTVAARRQKIAHLRMTRLIRQLPSPDLIAEWREDHGVTEAA